MDHQKDVHVTVEAVHVHVHGGSDDRLLRQILRQLQRLTITEALSMANLDQLRQQVERDTTVTESAVTLLNQLADEIRNAGTDQAALNELADRISQNSDELAAAVSANTAAEDETPTEPTEGTEGTSA